MFGASVVRQKRERERRERALKELDPPVIPYIKPFGARFDASQLPYFKYRQALAELEAEKQRLEAETPTTQSAGAKGGSTKAELLAAASPPPRQEEGGVSALLYVGLGLVAVGMVITFVGLGDKGFKSLQLRLIGPGLVGLGLLLTVVRVLLCVLPPYIKGCRNGKARSGEEAVVAINGPLPNGQAVTILPGGQYPASPRGKVAFALPQSLNQGGGEMVGVVIGSSVSCGAVESEKIEDNQSISSSSASSTFSPGEDDTPPFLADQKSHIEATQNQPNIVQGIKCSDPDNLPSDEQPSIAGDKDSVRESSGGSQQPRSENRKSNCYESNLQGSRYCESQLNSVDSDSIISSNNKWNGIQMGTDELFGDIESTQWRKCSLTESRIASASTLIDSSAISSRLFKAETLDSPAMASQ